MKSFSIRDKKELKVKAKNFNSKELKLAFSKVALIQVSTDGKPLQEEKVAARKRELRINSLFTNIEQVSFNSSIQRWKTTSSRRRSCRSLTWFKNLSIKIM